MEATESATFYSGILLHLSSIKKN